MAEAKVLTAQEVHDLVAGYMNEEHVKIKPMILRAISIKNKSVSLVNLTSFILSK